jgi:hypothetical protein
MTIEQSIEKLKSLNRKMDVLASSVRRINSGGGALLGIANSANNAVKEYKHWKNDLLINFFIPVKK